MANIFSNPGLAASQLPPVTTADNDKVLTVDGGVWKAKTPSGGGVLVVTATEADGVLTCDKTAAEMYAAAQTGLVIVLFELEDISYACPVGASLREEGYEFLPLCSVTMSFTAATGTDYPSYEI